MNGWVWGVLGVVVGSGLAVLMCRLLYAARSAAVVAERDLLRERVIDLETSLAEDLETAALLAPLKEALVRVEHHVGSLERDRMAQFGSIRSLLARVEGGDPAPRACHGVARRVAAVVHRARCLG